MTMTETTMEALAAQQALVLGVLGWLLATGLALVLAAHWRRGVRYSTRGWLALAALPAPYDEQRLIDAQTRMEQAAQSVTAAEQAHLNAVRDAETLGVLMQQATVLVGRQAKRCRADQDLGEHQRYVQRDDFGV